MSTSIAEKGLRKPLSWIVVRHQQSMSEGVCSVRDENIQATGWPGVNMKVA